TLCSGSWDKVTSFSSNSCSLAPAWRATAQLPKQSAMAGAIAMPPQLVLTAPVGILRLPLRPRLRR
ncbi:hypothetical protein ScalyP_jg10946, partial [Parmales sp. scaly parma]